MISPTRVLAMAAIVVVLLIGVPVGMYVTFTVEQHHTCASVNKVRTQLLKLVDDGLERSKAAATASTATPIQKFNYERAKASAVLIHGGLRLDHC